MALAIQLLQARGWPVRPAEPADQVTATANRVAFIVEVRLSGSRRGARAAAESGVQRLAAEAPLGLWVRDSALVEPVREQRTTYHVFAGRSGSGGMTGWVADLWQEFGGADVQRSLSLPGAPDPAAARAELLGRSLGGVDFDSQRHGIRVAMAPRQSIPASGQHSGWAIVRAATAMVAAVAAIVLCGVGTAVLSGAWRAMPGSGIRSGALHRATFGRPSACQQRRSQSSLLPEWIAAAPRTRDPRGAPPSAESRSDVPGAGGGSDVPSGGGSVETLQDFSREVPTSSQGRCPVKDTGPELVLLGRGGGI